MVVTVHEGAPVGSQTMDQNVAASPAFADIVNNLDPRAQVVLKVLVPIAAAGIWEHLRACYAIGWASILLAEGYASSQVAGDTGIGFFMANMQRRHFMENYFAAVFVIIATGLVIDFAFKLVGRKLFPWQGAR